MSVGVLRREIVIKNGRNRKRRPKTFKTEEKAKAYIKENNIKDYVLENLKNEASSKNKFRISFKK